MSGIKPMLAKDLGEKPPRVPREPGRVIEPKHNGIRWMMRVEEDGVVRHWSGRNGREATDYAEKPAIIAIDKQLAWLPPGTLLDSELVSDGGRHRGHKNDSKTAWVFDVLEFNGQDVKQLMWHQRRELFLDKMGKKFKSKAKAGRVRLVPYFEGTPEEQQKVHEKWLELGMEGSISKRKESLYRPGSRTRDWIKLKPQESTEAIVIGHEMGKGESNTHLVGALKIKLLETKVETSCAKECTVEEAMAMVGKTCEIRHHGWQESGAVQHPIFYRWRPDRD